MKSVTQKTLKFVLALSLLAAFAGALSLFTSNHSGEGGWLSASKVEAAPVVSSARITFKNSKGQVIGEGRPFPLDRVSRGERYSRIVEGNYSSVRVEVRAANGYRKVYTAKNGYSCEVDTVSTNPSFDNVWVTVFDASTGHQLDSRRLPIGSK